MTGCVDRAVGHPDELTDNCWRCSPPGVLVLVANPNTHCWSAETVEKITR